jgi:hypothetical protein
MVMTPQIYLPFAHGIKLAVRVVKLPIQQQMAIQRRFQLQRVL